MFRRYWHSITALTVAAGVTLQLTLNLTEAPGRGFTPDPDAYGSPGQRAVTYFSFFTTQSNLLVLVGVAALLHSPERRDRWASWVHLAGLVGITITFLVNLLVLRPLTADLYSGAWVVADFALHYLTPALAVGGWLAFGPRPRFDARLLAQFLAWPALWLTYTFVRGARIDWYPYPFLDLTIKTTGEVVAGVAAVVVVGLLIGACFVAADGRLAPSGASRTGSALPARAGLP